MGIAKIQTILLVLKLGLDLCGLCVLVNMGFLVTGLSGHDNRSGSCY